jgi:RNA polymerase sigma-70 factor (ECF subfamily)
MKTLGDDDELVSEIIDGRIEAFEELMVRHQRLVYNIAFGCTQNREDALDLSQVVFLKAFEHLGSFRSEGSFRSWLARIAYNESINWIRKQSRESLVEELPESAAPGTPGQESRLLSRETRALLMEGMGKLHPRYRLAISMRYFEGMSLKEIAESQDCSVGMVKNTLFRSLRQLQRLLPNVMGGLRAVTLSKREVR